MTIDLEKVGDEIAKKLIENGFDKPPNDDVAGCMGQVLNVVGEAGEFAEAFRRYAGLARRSGTETEAQEELADVVISAFTLASRMGWPLNDIIGEKAQKIRTRGWREGDAVATQLGTDPISAAQKAAAFSDISIAVNQAREEFNKSVNEFFKQLVWPSGDVGNKQKEQLTEGIRRIGNTVKGYVPAGVARIYKAPGYGTGYWFETTLDRFVYGWDKPSAVKHNVNRSYDRLPGLGKRNLVHDELKRNSLLYP